jgi:hypothetical protein
MIDVKRTSELRRGWGRLGALTGLALLALAGAVGTGAASTEIALPAADVVLDGYIEATGGKAAYGKVTNRVTKATLDLAAQGIKLDLTIYSARPNKNYTLIESDATGKMEKGTDGTTVWETSAMMGAQIKEGQEKTDFLREAMFDRMIMWRDVYKEAECVGVETVSDKPTYKVVLTPEDGNPQTCYFDQASKLLVKVDVTVETPMGAIPLETFLEDYREVGGVLLAHRTKIVTDLPEEIRALMEGKKEEAAASPKG